MAQTVSLPRALFKLNMFAANAYLSTIQRNILKKKPCVALLLAHFTALTKPRIPKNQTE